MKVLLVGIYDINTVSLAPQLLSAYAERMLPNNDITIQTVEFSIFSDTPESMVAKILSFQADVVCFSCYIWNFNLIKTIIPHLRAKIVLGGPQVTGIERQILQSCPEIDIIVTGEGEETFTDLLRYFSGQKLLSGIPGITTREIQTSPRDSTRLEDIPPLYQAIFQKNPNISWVSFETSRGCPMGCGYCTWGYNRKMRYFPLEYVLSELEIILRNPHINEIYLCDSSLLLNKERAKTILDHIILIGSDKIIRYEFSPDQLDDEIIERMIKLPTNEFNFGIQTTNPAALKEIGRTFDKEKFEKNYFKFIKAFPSAQITIDLIYGLPGDDLKGYIESMNYAMNLPGVTRILTNPLIALPGSRFFKDREKYGFFLADDESYLVMENYSFPKDQMLMARRYSFYLNVLFLNTAFKNALLKLSSEKHLLPSNVMIDFFESLPFDLVKGEYPCTIPSVKKDFEHRNRSFASASKLYPQIIDSFMKFSQNRFIKELEKYENSFTNQYYKFKKFADQTTNA